jgi:hypothetical protein
VADFEGKATAEKAEHGEGVDQADMTRGHSGQSPPRTRRATPSGIFDFLGTNALLRLRTVSSNGDEKSGENMPIPGGLPTGGQVATAHRGPVPPGYIRLSTALIIALIAFLVGSLLRSLLTPAEFVYVPDTHQNTLDLSASLIEAAVGDLSGLDGDGRWREMRRLFEFKGLAGGWDFLIAVVRRP